MIDLPFPRLLTARLTGEPLSPFHEPVIVKWWEDADFTRMIGGPRPAEETRQRLIQSIAEGEALQQPGGERPWRMTWVLGLRASGDLVGWVGLRQIWLAGGRAFAEPRSLGESTAEVFYAVAPDQRGQGLVAEAAAAALAEGRRLGVLDERTIALVLPQNRGSRRVLEKLGFVTNGTLLHGGIPHLLYERREPIDVRRESPRVGSSRPHLRTGSEKRSPDRALGVGMIGAGRYLYEFLGPLLREQIENGAVRPTGVVTLRGQSAARAQSAFGFRYTGIGSEGLTRLFSDPETEAVIVATRHDTHAQLAAAALRAGRHVLVEKPLALTDSGLAEVEAALSRPSPEQAPRPPYLLTGFNRRFAPLAEPLVRALRSRSGPFQLSVVVNARPLPAGHWRQDRAQGGGRLLGHAVHFLDLARFLVGSRIEGVEAEGLDTRGQGRGRGYLTKRRDPENLLIKMAFEDGSLAVVHYCPAGDPRLLGEQLWVGGGGLTAWVNNWAALEIWADGESLFENLSVPDKGFRAELGRFVQAIRSDSPEGLIPLGEQLEIARWAIRAARDQGG